VLDLSKEFSVQKKNSRKNRWGGTTTATKDLNFKGRRCVPKAFSEEVTVPAPPFGEKSCEGESDKGNGPRGFAQVPALSFTLLGKGKPGKKGTLRPSVQMGESGPGRKRSIVRQFSEGEGSCRGRNNGKERCCLPIEPFFARGGIPAKVRPGGGGELKERRFCLGEYQGSIETLGERGTVKGGLREGKKASPLVCIWKKGCKKRSGLIPQSGAITANLSYRKGAPEIKFIPTNWSESYQILKKSIK